MLNLFALIISYLLGSISCAILVAKYAKLPDPRTQGSGNPGATNMLRTAGKKYAIITLLGDALKGVIAVLLARIIGLEGWMLALVAAAAVIGHMYPVFFQFKGGKGVATALGSYLAISPILGIIALLVWVGLAYVYRYASLSSLVASIVVSLASLIIEPGYFLGLFIIAGLIVWRHRANIERLQNGTESKLNLGK